MAVDDVLLGFHWWFGGAQAPSLVPLPASKGASGVSLPPPYPPAGSLPRPAPALLQNFEQYEDESAGLTPGGSRSRPIADPNFIGYTYKGWDAVHGSGDGGPGSGQGE